MILSKDKNLYAICPLGVKRRIWKQQPELFQGEIYPMFQEYRDECDTMLRSTERVFLDQVRCKIVVQLVSPAWLTTDSNQPITDLHSGLATNQNSAITRRTIKRPITYQVCLLIGY